MSIPFSVDSLGKSTPAWLCDLNSSLWNILEGAHFITEYLPGDSKLVVHTDRVDDETLDLVKTAAESYMPDGATLVSYNHDISIPWQEIPEGFTVVEYLESSSRQYIETDIIPDIRDELTLDCQNLESSSSAANYIFVGSALASDVPQCSWAWGVWGSTALNDFAYSWMGQVGLNIFTSSIWTNQRKTERFLINLKNGELQINKEKIQTLNIQSGTVSRTRPYKFFIRWETADVRGRLFKFERKNVDLGEKNVLVPCLDPTGAPCMFDLISRKPFYNMGSGDFTYPTARSTFALRRVLPDWGKLTEHGLRRLYHAPKNYKGELYDYALENGFKPIVEPEMPLEGYWVPEWRETETQVILDWIETDPPSEDEMI